MLIKETHYVSSSFDADVARRLEECDEVFFFTEGGSHYVSGFKGQTKMVYAHLSEAQSRRLQGFPEPNPFEARYYDGEEHDAPSYGIRR
ncbi:hypothetical protein [Rhizobium leguminosarum]|uniref:hypothetical protein n=1 Tax=Rhizobium leguminosarum TaxID=384 RepID=UPI002E111420|nr:hypothetical protein U8Q02_42350 [Rhizobium leguminosarum]